MKSLANQMHKHIGHISTSKPFYPAIIKSLMGNLLRILRRIWQMIELNFDCLESCPNSFSNALETAMTRKSSDSRVGDPFHIVKIQLLHPHSETDATILDPRGLPESSIIRV